MRGMSNPATPLRRHALKRLGLCAALSVAGLPAARAATRLEIVGVGATRVTVIVAPFEGDVAGAGADDSHAEAAFHRVLAQDFERSGLLRPLEATPELAGAMDARVQGTVQPLPDGQLSVRWTLWDPLRRVELATQQLKATPAERRLVAHRIADTVQELLTGVRGVNATRIAYIVQDGARHLLKVADADGHNHRTALTSHESIISPAWSPLGDELAYVSFEQGRAQVWVQALKTGRRQALAAYRGSNSAPAWSPDGRQVAFASSRDGTTQLFIVAREGGSPRRVAPSTAIDTEPAWAPDGRSLYFTSDRGGSPQIYRVGLESGVVERVSFDAYSVSPSISPQGDKLAYISNQEGALRVVVKTLASGSVKTVTRSVEDERPSFAPNGRLLVYATREGRRDLLMTSSIDGRVQTRLLGTLADVREPAWGPWPEARTG